MTENGSHQYTLPDDDASTITTTCGKACAGYETRLWDQENPDREAEPGEVGEIGTRGALLMLGYFDNQCATENSFNAGGWFMSGDLGRFDESGNLQIVGRKKDLIIRGGHNIHPARHREPRDQASRRAQGGRISRRRRAARRARVPRCGAAGRGTARRHGAARASARRRAFEVRHARILHRDGSVSADRERQDPEARARRMDEGRARCAAAGALDRPEEDPDMAIELTRVDEFALITLNRPEALNALSFALIRDLGRALGRGRAERRAALLITGAGTKAFCAGADIKELTGDRSSSRSAARRWARRPSRSSSACRCLRLRSSTAMRSAAGSSWRSRARSASPPATRRWACRRSSSASSPVTAARSGCRASSARRGRSR